MTTNANPTVLQRNERVIKGPRTVLVPGSDAKSKTPVVDECRLCRKHTELLLSHVAPKWTARWAKAEGKPVGDYRSLGVVTETPDWPKHYLLCHNCEQHLGDAERYVSKLNRGTAKDLDAIGVTLTLFRSGAVLRGINASLMSRFIAGNALRAHFASSYLYQQVQFTPPQLHKLRTALLADYYPAAEFSFFACKFYNTVIRGANPRAMLYVDFSQSDTGGGAMFDTLMAGMSFGMHLGRAKRFREAMHPSPFVETNASPFSLGSDWFLLVGEHTLHRQVELALGLHEVNKKLPPDHQVQPGDPCPCGLDLEFGQCCSGRWMPPGKPVFAPAGAA